MQQDASFELSKTSFGQFFIFFIIRHTTSQLLENISSSSSSNSSRVKTIKTIKTIKIIPGINEARVRPLVDVRASGAAADLVAVLLHELGQTQYLEVQCAGH